MSQVTFCVAGNFLTTTDSDLTIMADGSLRLSSVEIGDRGVYSCVASNAAGKTSQSIRLIVHG